MGLFNKKSISPPTIPTDEIVPMHDGDSLPSLQDVQIEFTCRFNDVLDANKLKKSLERLLEFPGWRKLGGRVRLNDSGKIEYHVPAQYNDDRPGFLWSHQKFSLPIDDHPLASQLPKPRPVPTIFPDPIRFHDFLNHPNHPHGFDDWVTSDCPPLSVKLITFNDASLLTLSWSHTLLDALGCEQLLHAWIAILDGREHEVPPFHGYQEDPLASIDIPSSSEPYILTDHLLNPIGLILFLIYTLWDRFFHRSESAREIQIPDHFVQHLKTTAPPSTFLTDNDVLTAWLTHLSLSTSTYSRTRPVNILTLFNLRPLFPTAFPPGTAFLGNALGASQSLFPPLRDLLRQPLGLTAWQLRRDLTRQRTVSQVVASRALGKQLGRGVFCGRSDQILQVWTNWHRARFFDVSFAGAVVSGEGRPVYITTNGHYAVPTRNVGIIIGRDPGGNWWVVMRKRDKDWPAFERSFRDEFEAVELQKKME